MDVQLKKGLIEFCVLCAIEKADSYGYKILKDLSGYMVFSESTLYSILRRMEEAGYVIAYTEEYNNRLRKYFHLTQKGQQYLEEFRQDISKLMDILKYIKGDAE